MSDIKPGLMLEIARRVMAEHRETLEALHKGGVEAAPESAYAPEDRAFYKFWYAHMKDDQMLPPLSDVHHADARYIWNAAAKQAAEDAVRELRKRLEDPHMVHLAMLRGEIGTPDIRDILHVHGADALSRWDRAEQAAEMERERILDLLNDVQEPEWYGRGHPYTFHDGVIACHRAIRGAK